MALTVLIVEDDQSAARVLSGIAAEVGLSARTTASGKEAQQLCAQAAASGAPFSAVVLDLVLAELDGFQFAKAARAHPWGAQLPLVVVSGVYKQLPADFAAQVKPAAFFAKPFEPAALRGALARLTGAQPASPTLEGELSDKPTAALFVELLRAKATGTLTLTLEQEKRVITFQQGQVRLGQSNLKSETMGAAQIASGLIKQTSFDRAVALAKQQGIPLHEALATARVMTPDSSRSGRAADPTRWRLGPGLARAGGFERSRSGDQHRADAHERSPGVGGQTPRRLPLTRLAGAHAGEANGPRADREIFAVRRPGQRKSVAGASGVNRRRGERASGAEFPCASLLRRPLDGGGTA
jgi:CheY-like chemotaxis protein